MSGTCEAVTTPSHCPFADTVSDDDIKKIGGPTTKSMSTYQSAPRASTSAVLPRITTPYTSQSIIPQAVASSSFGIVYADPDSESLF
jgi:hypothetical protein